MLRFLEEYQDLSSKIQIQAAPQGCCFLSTIGEAMRQGLKLRVEYRKYSDEAPYQALMHPYTIKLFNRCWYMLAIKEGSTHGENRLQCFSLDRFVTATLTDEHFDINPELDADSYFTDSYGVWVDKEKYPVQTVSIAVTRKVANYLLAQPLHHSQRQLSVRPDQSLVIGDQHDAIFFQYTISPTPDFMAELKKWGNEVIIMGKMKESL